MSDPAVFAGERAVTADQGALEHARALERVGTPPRAIWSATGWFRVPDGDWRWEIDDRDARLVGSPFWAVEHPELAAAYPALVGLRVEVRPGPAQRGVYWPAVCTGGAPFVAIEAPDAGSARLALLHELQHAVQALEGVEFGGSGHGAGAYRELAGEVEARAVQARADLSPERRRGRYPPDDYDVPAERVVLQRMRMVT